ncbi:trimeric intracellular cation channel family protein [Saprospiraceae bacterium]|nr:trimeric intracellular cation channel family protein [Saprospiraceae bacterium]
MNIIYAFDLIGTFVFAISGVMTAIDKKFDFVGAAIIGFVTAVGGGTLRDILIGSTPVGWMQDEVYIYLILSAVPLCYIFKKYIVKLRRSIFLFDTIGIGLFTILGIEKTLSIELSFVAALLMGISTAVFGGIVRDVLCNEVPLIFRREIYATACLVGGISYIAMEHFLDFPGWNMVISIFIVMLIRVLAVKNKWHFSPSDN